MATARVDFDPATTFGAKLRILCQFGDQFRQYVSVVAQEVAAFAGDAASFAAKTGVAVGSAPAVMDQVARMNGELNGVILPDADLDVGETSFTKTVLDRMG